MLRICLLFLLAACTSSAEPEFSGRISVVDGDTIRIGDQRVRLHGIDAPEVQQSCRNRTDGLDWLCGEWSGQQVRLAYEGKQARCSAIDVDQYGRVVARCFVGEDEINKTIVERGLAVAYLEFSNRYIDAEKAALAAQRGIWGSDFVRPDQWRSAGSVLTNAPAYSLQGCVIKGNVSNSGLIYHVPGQENYAITKITPSKGERWFCSEEEARAAGWRRARR